MRFSGPVGFGVTEETAPGVWADVITEKPYFGDVVRSSRTLSEGEVLNQDISTGTSVSIVADAYASEHIFALRYVGWQGALWSVVDVDATQRPRLLLRLGGVYNGPTG